MFNTIILIQHKEEMLQGVKQHVPRVSILPQGSLNHTVHSEEHGSDDSRQIEYCLGNERH